MSNLAIPVVFFGLALWFFVGPQPTLPDLEPAASVSPADIDPSPRRTIFPDPPTIEIGGLKQRCSDCHKLFDTPLVTDGERLQHGEIHLRHGINNQCSNCHSNKHRDRLVLYLEQEIGYDQVELLCQKCHGPTYRDWERGMHGRSTGSWDPKRPERGRLVCTQCHDPHSPAFPTLKPLPGPHTLRMGDPGHGEPAPEDPLLKHMRTGPSDHD